MPYIVQVCATKTRGGDLEQDLVPGQLVWLGGGGLPDSILGAFEHGEGRHDGGCARATAKENSIPWGLGGSAMNRAKYYLCV